MMNRSQVVSPHSKQILNDAVDTQEPLRMCARLAVAHGLIQTGDVKPRI